MNQTPDPIKSLAEADSEDVNPDTIDTGEPIYLLANLEEPASEGFLGRLGRRIERRRLGADVTGLLWHGPLLVVIEFLKILFENSSGPDKPTSS